MLKSLLFITLGFASACGSSKPAPDPEPDYGSNLTCDERLEGATKEWSDVRDANLTCTADADCALVFTATACRGACQVAVSASGAAALEAAVKSADGEYCSSFQADGCPFATPKCALGEAWCNAGSCDVRYPAR